jgi:hypothetical protein
LYALFLVENKSLDLAEHPWYKDIIYYLEFKNCPDNLENHQRRRVRLEASKYLILGTSLFHRTINGSLLHCVENETTQKILREIHGSTDSGIHIGGHFVAKSTTIKILRIGYY